MADRRVWVGLVAAGAMLGLAGPFGAFEAMGTAPRLAYWGAEPAGAAASATPPILARLQPARRGRLLSLSAEDDYVRVRTTAGEALVLMRLGDAVAEAAPGLRVHRSHWVARAAVAEARRAGDGAVLTLRTGEEIPVSRANLPRLRETGLAPRAPQG